MGKIYGLFGTMTGKVADVVMAVRNGEQIVRKYQPVVANPKSEAQTENRAKLKLISQLSAVMGPVIAIPHQGTVSSRNLFTKKNFRVLGFENGEATVNLSQVKLTSSVVSMPRITASRTAEAIEARIISAERPNIQQFNRVIYVGFTRANDGTLRLFDSVVVRAPGNNNEWRGSIALTDGEVYIYAYAVRDNTETARVIFSDMTITSATAVASLIVSRRLTETDVTLTESVYYYLAAASQSQG